MPHTEHIISSSSRPNGHFGETLAWTAKSPPKWLIVDNFFRGKEAYDEAWPRSRGGDTLWVEAGEELKSLGAVEQALSWLSERGATRSDSIAVIGGGTVLDYGLFVAAIFQRGMQAWSIPTTLLAAVDAGIGGKNGVNFQGLKNYIGTITQPAAILTDLQALNTLPPLEVMNGWMEMAKHGLIADSDLWLEMSKFTRTPAPSAMHNLIEKAAQVKNQIVSRDGSEMGERKSLNFGHTLAHALESRAAALNRELPHGIAVGMGLVFSLHWSASRMATDGQIMLRAASTIRQWLNNGAESLVAQTLKDFDADATWAYMQKDKKNAQNAVLEVGLKAIGEAHWNIPMTREEFETAWSSAFDPDSAR